MKKTLLLLSFLAFVLSLNSPSEAVYKVKPKPVFHSAQEGHLYGLAHGEIYTDGGYVKEGVWGTMEGVINAPSESVWKLFLRTNDWKYYRLPNLTDSRAVTEDIVREVGTNQKAKAFYEVLGDQVINPVRHRNPTGIWSSYTFQYYDLPWPLADKWMVVKNKNDEREGPQGVYKIEWYCVAGNVKTMSGSMILEPFVENKDMTRMEYHVLSNPGSKVPRFLIKWGVRSTMPAAIRAIRRVADEVYGHSPPLLKAQ